MDAIYIFKIIHIIGFVSWFAGLFYLVRIMVYHTEAYDKDQPEKDILRAQFHKMEMRVYSIICNPAMIITWIAGLIMIYLYCKQVGMEWLKMNYWLHFKILLVFILSGYLGYCKKLIGQLKEGKTKFSSTQFRLFNEVPTLFLILISSIAVFKNATNPGILVGVIVVTAIVLVLLTKLYKKIRAGN